MAMDSVPMGVPGKVKAVASDISDHEVRARALAGDVDAVVHLPTVAGERDGEQPAYGEANQYPCGI